jgi:hypothetical protein
VTREKSEQNRINIYFALHRQKEEKKEMREELKIRFSFFTINKILNFERKRHFSFCIVTQKKKIGHLVK